MKERIPLLLPRRIGGAVFFLFAVLIPFGTWLFELATGTCASVLFDPMPTPLHTLLILLVPAANFLVWRAAHRPGAAEIWPGWLSGASIGVAAFYTVMFAPLTPIAVVLVVVGGIGLFLLAPVLSLVGALVALSRLAAVAPVRRFWCGLLLSAVLLVGAEVPTTVTRVGLAWAADGGPAGLRLLRAFGQEASLLRACYVRPSTTTDMISFLLNLADPVDPEEARRIYYQITGRPFNAVPPPPATGNPRGFLQDDWVFDSDQAGEVVGGRLRDLFLKSSQMVSAVDSDGALSYTEWTLVFRNDHAWQDREARAQIALPPGGVVSRVTLWVKGEPREAAFASRQQTRQAYESVVAQSRDPLLVTTTGPDRVLVQCFPVPAKSGQMQVRVGITAPLELEGRARAWVRLPYFLERNFNLESDVFHQIRFQSRGPLAGAPEDPVPDFKLSNVRVEARRNAALDRVRSGAIAGRLEEQPAHPPRRTIFVVDGSRRMQPAAADLARALPEGQVVFASDEVLRLPANRLGPFLGGQDGVPALLQACQGLGPEDAVVFIHAPQPVELASAEPLRAALEGGPSLYDFQVGVGPNRVLEALDGLPRVQVVPRRGMVAEDLERFLAGLHRTRWRMALERQEKPPGAGVSDHLVRLWAASRVEELRREGKVAEAVKVAVRHQLVTPVSGAVVLESQEQYERAGLTPVEPGTTPTVPEPEVWALAALAAGMLLWARRRRLAEA